MKQLSVEVFLGLVIALPLIYVIDPRGTGATALLLILCIGSVTSLGTFIKFLRKKEANK